MCVCVRERKRQLTKLAKVEKRIRRPSVGRSTTYQTPTFRVSNVQNTLFDVSNHAKPRRSMSEIYYALTDLSR